MRRVRFKRGNLDGVKTRRRAPTTTSDKLDPKHDAAAKIADVRLRIAHEHDDAATLLAAVEGYLCGGDVEAEALRRAVAALKPKSGKPGSPRSTRNARADALAAHVVVLRGEGKSAREVSRAIVRSACVLFRKPLPAGIEIEGFDEVKPRKLVVAVMRALGVERSDNVMADVNMRRSREGKASSATKRAPDS